MEKSHLPEIPINFTEYYSNFIKKIEMRVFEEIIGLILLVILQIIVFYQSDISFFCNNIVNLINLNY